MDCSPARLLCPWDSLGKNTGVGCHFLLQGKKPITVDKKGLFITRNYSQYPVINHDGREHGEEHTHVHNRVTCCAAETEDNIANQLYFNKTNSKERETKG